MSSKREEEKKKNRKIEKELTLIKLLQLPISY
jgi:hypothetical protein